MATSLTHLIPFSELAPGQAGAIRNEIISRMVSQASLELKLSADKLVVRDIRAASDIALYSKGSAAAVEDWACVTGTTTEAYETMATGTMSDQAYIGIFGVKLSEFGQACTALKFNIGGGDRAIWQLQGLSAEDDYVGFCPSGIIIPQSVPYTISRWVRIASASAFIVLKGVVIEPRGKVISP